MHVLNTSNLHVNYRYVLNFLRTQGMNPEDCRVLDYGCGSGEIVEAGRAEGFSVFGTDIFYSPEVRTLIEAKAYLGDIVREIEDGKIPFGDDFFDLVVSNQVFEHVQDLELALSEIARVLKPGGKLLALFPSRDVWRENHCGIPFLHWFPPESRWRYRYAFALRCLGFGKLKQQASSRSQWVENWLMALDLHCFYRSRGEIERALQGRFRFGHSEDDYILFRLGDSWRAALVRMSLIRPLAVALFRRLAGLVIVAEKNVESIPLS